MRIISQIIVAILLVGVAVASGSILAYMVTDLVKTYQPSQVMITRVGGIDVELSRIRDDGYYEFTVSTKLSNMGSTPYTIPYGWIIVLVKGSTGQGKVMECFLDRSEMIAPGEIKTISATCMLSPDDLRRLFGEATPPADKVKEAFRYLYLRLRVYETTNSGGGGSGGLFIII